MNKLVRIFYILLLVISAILCVLFYTGGTEIDGTTPIFTNTFILYAYILTGIAVVASLIFPVFQMITNPKNAKKSLLGVLALVVVVILAYVFSSAETLNFSGTDMEKFNVPSLLKKVDTGIITTYILVAVAIIAMIYSETSKLFK